MYLLNCDKEYIAGLFCSLSSSTKILENIVEDAYLILYGFRIILYIKCEYFI